MYVDLNPLFPKTDPARYQYLLRFTLQSHAKLPAVVLKGFYLSSMLQMAPLAMPGLALGENQFIFTDDSPGETKARITQIWKECDSDIAIPAAPGTPSPSDGKTFSGTQVKFQWAAGAGPTPADYEFELSEFSDMRWVLSPNFHKLISRTANRGTSSFTLPYDGLLNPGQTYYWHVRARSEDGVWGPWSKTFLFSTQAPAVPIGVAANFDPSRRIVRLTWEAGKGGSDVTSYRVYGSEERGFSANDTPYEYNAGMAGILTRSANLLLQTPNPSLSIEIPEDLWRPFYRVVAVDHDGRVSGASAIAELPHPLITTSRLPDAIRSHFYEMRIRTSASIGHLVSADEDGQQYQIRYRSADDLMFGLTGAPKGLSIDDTGLISGFLGTATKGNYELAVNVTNKNTGTNDSIKLPLAVTDDRP
jgi:hypothetical protein